MFKLAKSHTFTHEVKVRTPVDGGYSDEKFKATFELLTVDERVKYDLRTPDGSKDFLVRAIRRLDELTDEKGEPLPYSDEVRDQVINLPHVRVALAAAYFEAVANDPKSGN
jgi:hypothetical protein